MRVTVDAADREHGLGSPPGRTAARHVISSKAQCRRSGVSWGVAWADG